MNHSQSATKNNPGSKVETSPIKQKEAAGDEQLSNSNLGDYSRPTSAPPKLYTSLFLYTNDPFGCFTNDNQDNKDDEQYNKFFTYMQGNKESNQHPRQNGSNEAENLETKHGEMNTIPEAKSDLDVSDMLSRQNSSLVDARLSPDRIDSATNRAIMDMFEEGFTLSDPKGSTNDQNNKESFPQEHKGSRQNEKRYRNTESKKGDENPSFPPVMFPQMGYMQAPYFANNPQPFYNMMPQDYNYVVNDGMYGRGMVGYGYPYVNYFPYGMYPPNRGNQAPSNFGNNQKGTKNEEHSKSSNSNSNNSNSNQSHNNNANTNNSVSNVSHSSTKKDKKHDDEGKFNDSVSPYVNQVMSNSDPVEIDRLIENALKLAKDQAGCRMLQKKLETNDPEVISRIFEEVINEFPDLMIDPFGNYLCQKLAETCSHEEMKRIIEVVSPNLISICFNPHGTRAVQKLIEVVKDQELIDMVIKFLSSDVVGLVKDNNGNHVVQKCLTHMSDENKQFIYNSIIENCIEVATHKHGCCVIQRCLDHANKKQKEDLISVIVTNALELVTDQYGNYVVQYVLDLKDTDFSVHEKIAMELIDHIVDLSKQKFSSNVVEKCLQLNITAFREKFISLLNEEEVLIDLICDKFGNYVVQRYLTNVEENENMLRIIHDNAQKIKNDVFGFKIFTKLCKVYPSLGEADGSNSHTQFNDNVLSPNSNSSTNTNNVNNANVGSPTTNANTTNSNSKHNNLKENNRRNNSGKNEKKNSGNNTRNSNRHNHNNNNNSNYQRGHYRHGGNNNMMYHNNMRNEMPPGGMPSNMMQPSFYMPQPQIYGQYFNYPHQGVFYSRNY